MKFLKAISIALVGSLLSGVITGYAWSLGNQALEVGLISFVMFAIPANLIAALVFYFAVRGGVSTIDGGIGYFLVIMVINLVGTLGIAAAIAGVIGTGTGRVGAHAFSWGMSWGYGQAYFDRAHGTWFGE